MVRSPLPELMDDPSVPAEVLRKFHAELARLNRLLGNNQLLIARLKQDLPRTVLDIGCGEGALLASLRKDLGVEVIGIDLRAPAEEIQGIPIIAGDATVAELPRSAVAISVLTIHHLTEQQVVALVRNVGRYCQRFIILDLVRHPTPLVLFSIFLRPFVNRIVMLDGQQSIRRAYTPEELRALVVQGLSGTNAVFEHWVSAIYGKQVIDIHYQESRFGPRGG